MPEKKPTRTADLDYFYGQSSELFSFYRIPKLLFQDTTADLYLIQCYLGENSVPLMAGREKMVCICID